MAVIVSVQIISLAFSRSQKSPILPIAIDLPARFVLAAVALLAALLMVRKSFAARVPGIAFWCLLAVYGAVGAFAARTHSELRVAMYSHAFMAAVSVCALLASKGFWFAGYRRITEDA